MRPRNHTATLLIMFFFTTPSCIGQISTGIKAGINFSDIKGKGNREYNKAKTGFHAGIMSTISLNKKLYVNPEILYSAKGAEFSATQIVNRGKLKLDYLSIPILLGVKSGKNFSFLIGPEIGILLSAKSEIDGKEYDFKDAFEKADIGINIGVRLDFSKRVGMEARYSHGISDTGVMQYIDGMGQLVRRDEEGGNRVFQVCLFCFFYSK